MSQHNTSPTPSEPLDRRVVAPGHVSGDKVPQALLSGWTRSGTPADLAGLQSTIGNRAVGRMLARSSEPDPRILVAGPGPAARADGPSSVVQLLQIPSLRAASPASSDDSPGRVVSAQRSGDSNHDIQRHSSWEHKLLGDADPMKLSMIGTWQNLIDQTALKGGSRFTKGTRDKEVGMEAISLSTPQGEQRMLVTKGGVMHSLAQEMKRLKDWQDEPPVKTGADDSLKEVGKDPAFEVLLVKLPAANDEKSMIVTYGELNTLADFYGDLDTMKTANPKQRRQIVQSVRKESYLRLKEIYTKLEDSLTSSEKGSQSVVDARAFYKAGKLGSASFSGAAKPDFISGVKGQADLLAGDKPLLGQGTGARGATNKYGVTLARNACHFVPESWHAWADYHDKGLAAALDAYGARQAALAVPPSQRGPLDSQAGDFANEAILNNGFGDHYLQDSYASGHMLNKTQIMQWYVEFIDKSSEWDYFKDKNWRKVQQMAYRQPGLADAMQYDKSRVKGGTVGGAAPRNPQSVENMSGTWEERFDALGLQVPASLRTPGSPERQVIEWWQTLLLNDADESRERSGAELLGGGQPLAQAELERALLNLIHDGVIRTGESVETRGSYMGAGAAQIAGARFTHFGDTAFILREDYIPKKQNKAKFEAALAKSRGSAATADKAAVPGDDSDYQTMAKSVTYGDYFEFMNSGFIQKATNALHDTFCKNGLDVLSGDGAQVFKVYGDDSMFNAASAKGVEHSAVTANMSRDSILSVINQGNDGGKSTSAILGRLPAQVQYKVTSEDGETITTVTQDIAAWHNSSDRGALKDKCMTEVFPGMSGKFMQKFVPGAIGSELGKVFSKDQAVHGTDAF